MNFVSQKKLFEARKVSVGQLDQLRADLQALSDESHDLQERFLTEERLSSFFADVRQSANKQGIEILIQVKEKQPLSEGLAVQGISCETLPVDITLNGDYRNMISFLAVLSEEPFLMNIARIAIQAPVEESDIIEANLRLVVYLAHF
jgi:Tfp pilus assembly protein PilO